MLTEAQARTWQAVEKHPSASLRSSFVIATYCKSTPHSSRFRTPCIWMFLTSLEEKITFSKTCWLRHLRMLYEHEFSPLH
jgi:hypothetical protein